MNIRRWSVVGLTAAMLVPGLTACKQPGAESDAESSATPSVGIAPSATTSAAPGDAKQTLLDATREIGNGNFRFSLDSGGTTATGTVHKPSHSAQLHSGLGDATSDLAMDLDLIYIEPDTWVRVTFDGAAADAVPALKQYSGRYLHIDPARAKDSQDLIFNFDQLDPAGSEGLARAVVSVGQTATGQYAGIIDLTRTSGSRLADQALVAALGDRATSVPFTAMVDEQGRLTNLAIQVPTTAQTKARELKISYSDYGAATPAQKPAASETQEAPPELYQLFNR
ncbi:hypothetical protein [Plantactinospora sp. KBS50]|uniref:hypothetical protein n=1 Tax=Plantactinospora sp. KBS50 TaxID=2024580 RepID=UPI000BAAF9A5|nr:hypothetical protein [Plantactinospora sp. KBS50]ASW56679.1 hypothetical protein CIK06_24750 [Plantactinospora sp. KBS50]